MDDKTGHIDDSSTHLTNEERISRLNRIYDNLLQWIDERCEQKKFSGTAAAFLNMKNAREEMVAWENKGVSKQDHTLHFDIPGLDFSGYDAENSADA